MKNKKEITFFISSLAGGGAQGVCVNLVNGLVNRGWSVTLVVLNMTKSVYHDLLDENVNFVVLNVPNASSSFKAIFKYIKKSSLKKVVVFNYELSVVLLLIRIFTPLKYSIIARNINSFTEKLKHSKVGLRSRAVLWLMLRVYSKSDHIINQCQGMENDLLSVFPKLKNKTSTIYNPVNLKVENYAEKIKFNELRKQDYILCIGRLEKQKSLHYAIKSFAAVSSSFPTHRLKIVGTGTLEEELKEFARKLKIFDKVDFEGFQKNTIPYYMNAKLTLLTSLYEGFPNVLIESITLGTPVVSFDCKSGPREIIEEGVNGYLVEFQHIELLEKKLYELLNNPLDFKNVHLSASKYKADLILNDYIEVIENIN